MKAILSFLLLALQLAAAFPTQEQAVFSASTLSNPGGLVDATAQAILSGKQELETWFHSGKEYIKQNGLLYELVSHPHFHDYQLRFSKPKLCDPSVKQYSGYLDGSDSKHLFFWFFEARNSPETAPLILWLNGGPGCSSTTGLLFELGPCAIADNGQGTKFNPNSWNTNANIIFLDQPVNVGYSYSDDGSTVNNTPAAAIDVYAFLELFLNRFPEYADVPFHIAAESYGGTYAPNFANLIHKQNKQLSVAPTPGLRRINLASVILANGLTDPYTQMGSIADYLCDGPFPVFDTDGPQCASLRTKIPTCQRLINSCYKFNSRFTCMPAIIYCNTQLFSPLLQSGLNPYDVRVNVTTPRTASCATSKWGGSKPG
ncbi:hypothetical protein ONZ45_g18075 [Pleurotus djamor]|nr:hypothetical protein ONZ45_g18075 [Pleurotus djamor]